MRQTINEWDFVEAFKRMGRGNQFSREGLSALFEFLEDMDENYELDVVALCCEFAEYESLEEFQAAYSTDYATIDDVREVTLVLDIPGSESFIIQQF